MNNSDLNHYSENSSRKVAELGLASGEDIFRLLIDAVGEYAIFALDLQGTILTWNSGGQRLFGYTAPEIVGRHFGDFYTQPDLDREQPQHGLALAAEYGKYEDEGWRVRKDGSTFWANVILTVLKDEDGTVHGFGAVTRDLTTKKKAEMALRKSEERVRLMVDSVQDYAIFMLDTKGNITTWNKGAERNKGYKANEIIGKHFSVFYPESDRIAGKPERELGEAVKNGRVEDEGWRVRKDGSTFWANVVITPLYDESEKLVGFTKVTRNLTERKAAEDALREAYQNLELRIEVRTKELNEAKQKAEAAVQARDQFFSMASHELRTPLFSLKLQSQLRQRALAKGKTSDFTPEKLVEVFAEDDKQIDRLASLVDKMLDLSRVSSGQLEISPEYLDLKEMTGELVKRMQPILEQTGNQILWTCPDGIQAKWDRVRIEQVVTNLLTNAGKYAPAKPVIVNVEKMGETVKIDVQDFGPGIPLPDQERIFQPFERVRGETGVQGLGLGLYISKRIVEEHGGSLTIQSVLDQGTVFRIQLPILSANERKGGRNEQEENSDY